MNTLQQLKSERREILRDMKARGIKRRSCFNGGHSAESYAMNSRLFSIETEISNREREGMTVHDCRFIES